MDYQGDQRGELDELAQEVRCLWHTVVRNMTTSGQHEGVERQGFWILGALVRGPLRMGDLAEATMTSQASLTGIVDRLEQRGLVERVRSLDDRRVVEVSLTDAGRELSQRTHERLIHSLEQTLSGLSPGERSQLLELLRKATRQQAGHPGRTTPCS